jgi:hypothetical protein
MPIPNRRHCGKSITPKKGQISEIIPRPKTIVKDTRYFSEKRLGNLQRRA